MRIKYASINLTFKTAQTICLFFLITFLGMFNININPANCASFSAGAHGSGLCVEPAQPWNPRLGDGLIGTYTASCSWDSVYPNFSGSASAAAYGSDTSWLGIASQYAEGFGVEPMAHAQAQANGGYWEYGPCPVFEGSSAWAKVIVYHRLKQRTSNPLPPDLPNLFEILNNVPIKISYNLSAEHVDGFGTAGAGFTIQQFGIGRYTDSGPQSGILSFVVAAGTNFSIEANAGVTATAGNAWCGGYETSSYSQAVADPFAYVEPNWEYAQHFIVEQTSELNPGEWVEVTRGWQTFCEADFDSDGDTDGKDFAVFLADFGIIECNLNCKSDYNEDGDVNENDLQIVAADFGKVNCNEF